MRQYFSKRLYLEGLVRTRTPGIITAVLTLVFALATPLNNLFADLITKPTVSDSLKVMGAVDMVLPLFLLLCSVPFFAMSSFGFLNKRHASDFYHALPYTRTGIFVSFLLGIMTWLAGIAFGAMALRSLLFALHSQIVVRFGSVMLGTLSYFIAALVLLGYILLALSFTGTRFSNIAVFVVLFSLPRYFVSTLVGILAEVIPMIDAESLPYTLFSKQYSLVSILFRNYVSGTNPLFLNPWMLICHLLFAIGLFCLGALVFVHRKSETAGNPATSRFMQHIWRLTVACPLALIATSTVVRSLYEKIDAPIVAVLAGLFLLFLSALSYLFYELLTTGKLRRFGEMCRYFLLIGLPILLLVLAFFGAKAVILNRKMPMEKIQSVILNPIGQSYQRPWETYQIGNLAITDETILQMVQKSYDETLALSKEGKYNDTLNRWESEYTSVPVKITTKNGTVCTYNLLFLQKDYRFIEERKMQIEEYREAYLSLPDEKSVSYFTISGTYSDDVAIYRAFVSAYEKLSDLQKMEVKEGGSSETLLEIYVSGQYKNSGQGFYSTYYINSGMTEIIDAIRVALNQSKWRGESSAYSTNQEAGKAAAEYILSHPDADEYFYMEFTCLAQGKVKTLFFDNQDLATASPLLTQIAQEIAADQGSTTSPNFAILRLNLVIDEVYENFTITISLSDAFVTSLLSYESE